MAAGCQVRMPDWKPKTKQENISLLLMCYVDRDDAVQNSPGGYLIRAARIHLPLRSIRTIFILRRAPRSQRTAIVSTFYFPKKFDYC